MQSGFLIRITLRKVAALSKPTKVYRYLQKIKAPVLALYPTGSNTSSADQETALRENIASVRVTHLDTPYAMLGMLQPRACAEQILDFAGAHDGIVCRE